MSYLTFFGTSDFNLFTIYLPVIFSYKSLYHTKSFTTGKLLEKVKIVFYFYYYKNVDIKNSNFLY